MKIKRSWFHVLLALAEGSRHGAEVQRRVVEHTEGELRLYPVTLYSALDDLVELRLIEEAPEPSHARHNERRRYYRITRRGRRVLADETSNLESAARLARAALGRRA